MGDKSQSRAAASVILTLDGLKIGYRGVPLFPAMSLQVGTGELWAVVGPNGAGKTTLLKTILGLLPPVSGACRLSPGLSIAYVPQRATLELNLPARVIDLVRGGVEQGWSFLSPGYRLRHRAHIRHAMKVTQVEELARRPYSELSEGQKQRVLMARALATDPSLLVLDEPTASMDHTSEQAVFALLSSLIQSQRLTVLLVSHHLSLVAAHATHLLMVDRDLSCSCHGCLASMAGDERVVERYGRLFAPPRDGGAK